MLTSLVLGFTCCVLTNFCKHSEWQRLRLTAPLDDSIATSLTSSGSMHSVDHEKLNSHACKDSCLYYTSTSFHCGGKLQITWPLQNKTAYTFTHAINSYLDLLLLAS